MLAFFPIVKNTFAGAANVDQTVLEPAVSMGAKESQIFTKVVIPYCVPFMMAGLRLAIGRGVVGMVVAEFLTAITGLGGLLVQYAGRFKTAQMFAPLFVIVMIGYGLTELVKALHEKVAPWKQTERDVS
ncbi:MAG: hypothetical protein A2W26_13350 [Acidobacteria bacterium RBG_16_64_8]|nr:MAG: hypothetical protein A2W26_13350 [Acidobacteria bacterium RBG_16_64_8]